MNDKYVKVVYQSEPIGKEHIILYLTTFDIDRYNHDLEKKEFGIEIDVTDIDLKEPNNIKMIEEKLNRYVKNFYEPYIKEVKDYSMLLKTTYQERIQPRVYDNVKNVNNVDKITCNNIYGNVNNCEVLYCNEIHGKVNNVEKIVYKKQ